MTKITKKTNSLDYKRLLFLSLFIFLLFAGLIAEFYKIQIIEGEKWSRVADQQHYFFVKDPFMRGTFISNTIIKKGHPETPQRFAIDVQKFHLYADPISIPTEIKEQVVKSLTLILNLNENEVKELSSNFNRKSRSRKLAMWLDKEVHDATLNWWTSFAKKNKIPRNALFFVKDYQRSYPFGKLLGQVLHTIQKVKEEKTLKAIPTGGLELYFDSYLTGKQGKRRLMRSPRNSLEIGEIISLPHNGADVHLTINHCLQAIAEEEIEKGVKKHKGKCGWAVMMDPYTGEILALAQYPFFSPADYQTYFNDPVLIEHTKVKAITDANEPGSIMKPITLAVALKANEELIRRNEPPIFDPEEMLPTSNPHFPGRKKPLKDTHFHYFLNMNMALQKSSNIYMARLVEKIIQRLGNKWYRETLSEDFGLGKKTGIELPSESPGLLPRLGMKHPNGTFEWSVSTPYSLAIGHNIQVNSLQILRIYALFANGGSLVKPTLVRKIVKNNGDGTEDILLDNTLTLSERSHTVISKERAQRLLNAMKFSTKPGGTSRRADVWGYSEAGKTGTADKVVKGAYDPHFVCASFVGIVPADNPAFVLIVTIDEPEYGYEPGQGRRHFGGFCSAPVFKEISQRSLEYLGINPDDPYGYPIGDPRSDPEKANWLPEIRQLQEKYEKWNSRRASTT